MKKRKIITIIVVGIVLVLLAGLFFIVKYDVMGKLFDSTGEQKGENTTAIDTEKIFLIDEEGNEVELVEEVGIEQNVIHDDRYEGTLVNIENNKLYFMVDKEVQEFPYLSEDVEDYQVVFDINTFNFKEESYYDALEYLGSGDEKDCYRFYSAGELEFLVGEYLSAYYFVIEDPDTKAIYKGLSFQPWSRIKSSIISFTQ